MNWCVCVCCVLHWQLLTDFCQVALTVSEDESTLNTQLQTAADDLQSAANSQLQVSEYIAFLEFYEYLYGWKQFH